jgi:hypothetical protein
MPQIKTPAPVDAGNGLTHTFSTNDFTTSPTLAVDNAWIAKLYTLAAKHSHTGIRVDQLHQFEIPQLKGMYRYLRRVEANYE